MYIENYEDKDEKTFIKIVDNVLTVVFNCFWGFFTVDCNKFSLEKC